MNHRICEKCERKYIPTSNNQKYCKECGIVKHKEQKKQCNKKFKLTHLGYSTQYARDHYKSHIKSRGCVRCGEEFMPTGYSQKYCKKCRSIAHNERTRQWQQLNLEKTKEYCKRCHNRRKRDFGYIPLNNYKSGYAFHHLDKTYGIYMPKEEHRSIWHSISKNINMDEINALAFNYLQN